MSQENEYGFVYLWFDRKHKRFYVGAHWGREDDGYVCSSTWMKIAHAHRPEDFKRKILSSGFQSKQEMFAEELRYLKMIKPSEVKVKYYNMHIGERAHWSGRSDAASIAKKSGDSRRGKSLGPCSEETKLKISKANSGKVRSAETKKKLSEIKSGGTLTDEHKTKIASSHKTKQEGYVHHTKLPGWTPKPAKLGSCVTCGSPTPSRRAKFCKSHFTTKPN